MFTLTEDFDSDEKLQIRMEYENFLKRTTCASLVQFSQTTSTIVRVLELLSKNEGRGREPKGKEKRFVETT